MPKDNSQRRMVFLLAPRFGLWLVALAVMLAVTAQMPTVVPPRAGAQEAPSRPQRSGLRTGDGIAIDRAIGGPAAADPGTVDPVRLAESRLAEADTSAAESKAAARDAAQQINFRELIRQGGLPLIVILIAILFVSIISMAFALERFLGLRRVKVLPRNLVDGLEALLVQEGGFDPRPAYKLCQQYPSTAANVVQATLLKLGRPNAELEHTVEEVSEREASRLYANVRWQNLAFNVAPMLGLLGTTLGMIFAFYETSHMGPDVSKAEQLATGIYTALVNTLAGLAVAIVAGTFAHVLETRILKLMSELDDLMRNMLPQLERFEGRAPAASEHPVRPSENAASEVQGKQPAVAPQ
jgi:biopolymer transport protein ExbB